MTKTSGALMAKSPGVRLEISPLNFYGNESLHYSGVGSIHNAPELKCPNCSNRLFPAINLTFSDPLLRTIVDWKLNTLHILICPFCAFYMEPYWIKHEADSVEIFGGFRDGGLVLQNINLPYECREISYTPLEIEDYPENPSFKAALLKRERKPGVYHQLGGLALKDADCVVTCCSCASAMAFCGILDYDDLNVPLYEDVKSPVALIIGDYDSMNVYACVECSVIALKWAK